MVVMLPKGAGGGVIQTKAFAIVTAYAIEPAPIVIGPAWAVVVEVPEPVSDDTAPTACAVASTP